MQANHQRAQAACDEALRQMRQGKLVQPRRLLEAALREDPEHLPTRLALVELAIRESNPDRAVRESKRATSIALLRCREAGVMRGEYVAHPTGVLLLQALTAGAQAHLAAGETSEAINALAVVLQEDPKDTLGTCAELIGVFFEEGRPEGVLGLFRLGYTHGLNLLDVVLAAFMQGAFEVALAVLVDLLERVPEARPLLDWLSATTEPDEPLLLSYLARRRAQWEATPLARHLLRRMVTHPIFRRTLELLDELDDDETGDEDVEETRAQLFGNLRSEPVVRSIMQSLARG
jgi:tetratricopeptide (TPR) repeat protein